ncbi:DUF4097 family beta strand repeat-containing protein [Actinophytocola sediminis]
MAIGRIVAAGAIVVTGLGVLSACGWDITKEKAADSADVTEEFTRVQFANDSGNVTITTGEQPSVARTIYYEDDQPGATHRVEDGTLVLDPCPTRDCYIDYEVVVPAGARVDGEVNSGNVEISGVAQTNLKANSSEVTVANIDGPVNVDANSGDVELRDIGGAAQVEANSGNVEISLTVPDDVRAKVSSGNVEVTVPAASYQVDAEADSGEVQSDITDDRAAEHHLDLSADSGNITITKA